MRFQKARPAWSNDWRVVKEDNDGGVTLRPINAMASSAPARPLAAARSVKAKDFTDLARENYEATTDAQFAEHARELGVSIESLRAMKVGWWEAEKCWGWPNRDDSWRVAGINRRFPPGDKRIDKFGSNKAIAKGHRQGVYVSPEHFRANVHEIVFCPEGGSDVAALITMGLVGIGRASNKAKPEVVAALAQGRRLVIVGELDAKPDGSWPGKEGAVHTARVIAGLWNETVEWSMMPDGFKDIRAWLQHHCSDPEDRDAAHRAGKLLVDALMDKSRLQEMHPGEPAPGESVAFTNVIEPRGNAKPQYITITQIAATLAHITNKWPRRAQGQLFAITDETPMGHLPSPSQIWKLDNADALFAWIQKYCAPRWMTKDCVDGASGSARTPVRKREFFEWLAANAKPNYRMVETLPHHPPVEDSFYVPFELPEGDGSAIEEFAAMINAETEEDRWLTVAAAITPAWGGPCGSRPAFLFTSEHGRGVGKSATAELIADLWGGSVTAGQDEDWDHLLARLLDDGSLEKRIVLMDNIKRYMSSSGMEAAVTAQSIDGKRMYHGQFSRPNRLTWLLTANAPSLSADLTSRAIPIKIGTPRHSADFQQWRTKFLRERRLAFIADAITMIRGESRGEIDAEFNDRWKEWIHGVLCKLPDPQKLLSHAIKERAVIDSDAADAAEVVEVVRGLITASGWDPDVRRYGIVKKVLADELHRLDVGPKKASTNRLTRWFKSMGPIGGLSRLSEDPDHSHGKAWLWTGLTDLELEKVYITTAPVLPAGTRLGGASGPSSGGGDGGPSSDPGPGKVFKDDGDGQGELDIPF